MFQTSSSTEKIDAALAKAQGEIKTASKDATNPHFKSKYADLASIYEACQGALSKHGVSVTQWPVHTEDGRLHLVTRMAHAGEWMQAELSLPVTKADAQGFGSAITYARRYALSCAVGVVADEDDDGNRASAYTSDDSRRGPAPVRTPPKLVTAKASSNWEERADALASYGAIKEFVKEWVEAYPDANHSLRVKLKPVIVAKQAQFPAPAKKESSNV